MAQALNRWLPKVLPAAQPWMSTDDIQKGQFWSSELRRGLKTHRAGIFCVTPENYTAPWLAFEAGALSNLSSKAKVIPLLLGTMPTRLEGPLGLFQVATSEADDVLRLLRSLNAESGGPLAPDVLRYNFDSCWLEFQEAMNAIAGQHIPADNTSINGVVQTLTKHGIAPSAFGSQVYFDGGFETHKLYSTVTDIATKQLLVFGRKNQKLLQKDHQGFLRGLKQKIARGFDFRLMFLDPRAPPEVLHAAHHDADIADQLRACIAQARKLLAGFKIDAADHCRTYRVHRTSTFVVVDGVVLYAAVALDETGRARPLTGVPFALVNASAPLGMSMVTTFETLWRAGQPIGG